MEKFLIADFDNLIKKVNKFDEQTGAEDVRPDPIEIEVVPDSDKEGYYDNIDKENDDFADSLSN
jgi:hypothetical protein